MCGGCCAGRGEGQLLLLRWKGLLLALRGPSMGLLLCCSGGMAGGRRGLGRGSKEPMSFSECTRWGGRGYLQHLGSFPCTSLYSQGCFQRPACNH